MEEGAVPHDIPREINVLTEAVIGAAIEVHRELGPGLLESLYEEAFCIELGRRGLPFRRQVPVPVVYKEQVLQGTLRLDLVIAEIIILELKAVDALLPIHEAQLLSYLKLTNLPVGLLINFHSPRLKDGIKRLANTKRKS
jgi:GxxExxY protein